MSFANKTIQKIVLEKVGNHKCFSIGLADPCIWKKIMQVVGWFNLTLEDVIPNLKLSVQLVYVYLAIPTVLKREKQSEGNEETQYRQS